MTRLLVSVRSAAEAVTALEAGAGLIDVKEPARGALGAADAECLAQVLSAVGGKTPVSAARGELLGEPASLPPELTAHLQYVKHGLAGCAARGDWRALWAERLSLLPAGPAAVAVVYADEAAGSPDWHDILETGAALDCTAALVDTFDKRGGGLVQHWPGDRLTQFIRLARRLGMLAVVAGKLSVRSIPEVMRLSPDYIAVRGAACRGGRAGTIDAARVSRLACLLRQGTPRRASPVILERT